MSEIDSIILNGIEYELAGGGGTVTMYSITNNLTNVTSSNGATSIREGRAYSATLSLATGATLDSVSVKMGGTDITSTTWNSSTMTISIASVTNDIVITARANIVIEETISFSGSGAARRTGVIDATENDLYWEIPYVEGASQFSSGVTAESDAIKLKAILWEDEEMTTRVGWYYIDTGEISTSDRTDANMPVLGFDTRVKVAPSGYYVQLYVSKIATYTDNANCYSYLANNANKVYLMTTPEPEPQPETRSNAELVDRDLLRSYALKSVTTNTSTVDDPTSYHGVIETAKNEWMKEWGGELDKIPLICHTDQHDTMGDSTSKDMWDAIDNMISWYEVSKVINFGDTTNSYNNYDDPTLGDTNLDDYLEATKNIPYSKRIECFGNHDCMKIIDASLTFIKHNQGYLKPYFKNVLARRTSDNGYHVTYDPYFNVKYVVYSWYDYIDSSHYDVVSPAQYEFLIEELSKNDGYDIIMCAHTRADAYHEYLGDLVQARYNKTSGSFTDTQGITHTYDFTGCNNDLIVVLHGHSHSDWSHWDLDVLSICFKNYYESNRPIYFVLVDKSNERLRLWKIVNTPAYYVYSVPFKPLDSISATYTQSGTVSTTDDLDDLKEDLVVTANWVDTTTSEVSSDEYALIGTLTTGTSTITVNYGNKTATFDVTVT